MINKKDFFPIGIGTWGIGGLAEKDPSINSQKQIQAMAYLFNSGFNFVEANQWYSQGHSVELLVKGLEKSHQTRDQIFLCQAIYLKDYGLEKAEAEIDQVLKAFNTNYVDTIQFTQSVFLNHSFKEVTQFVQKILDKGKARYTSITNHNLPLLRKYHQKFGTKLISHEVVHNFEIRANQELGIIPYAVQNKILTVVYQPLRRNRSAQRNWPILLNLSQKYNCTQNQLLMAWHIANGFLPLTKSESIDHINQHIKAIKIKLTASDLQLLNDFTPPGYQTPPLDWDKTKNGPRIDQLSNTFDEEYQQQK